MPEGSEALADFLREGIEQRDLNRKLRSVNATLLSATGDGFQTYGQNLRINRRKIVGMAFSAKSFLCGNRASLPRWPHELFAQRWRIVPSIG